VSPETVERNQEKVERSQEKVERNQEKVERIPSKEEAGLPPPRRRSGGEWPLARR
jgi:hypothetical protein